MKRTVFSLLLILASIALAAAQDATRSDAGVAQGVVQSAVQGTVTRAGTTEPLSEVQVALEGAVSPEAMKALLSDVASAGIAINPPPGASLSETTQLLIATAAAR